METRNVIYPKPLRLGHNSMEHGITLLLHVGPNHKNILGDGILSVLNHCEVPIGLKVIPKTNDREARWSTHRGFHVY
jgi:hypothetical protein